MSALQTLPFSPFKFYLSPLSLSLSLSLILLSKHLCNTFSIILLSLPHSTSFLYISLLIYYLLTYMISAQSLFIFSISISILTVSTYSLQLLTHSIYLFSLCTHSRYLLTHSIYLLNLSIFSIYPLKCFSLHLSLLYFLTLSTFSLFLLFHSSYLLTQYFLTTIFPSI